MKNWYLKSETGPLKDVLLGPAESFRWMGLENAQWSSLVRDTPRRGEYAAVLRFHLDNDIPVYDMISAGNFEGGDFNIIKPGVALGQDRVLSTLGAKELNSKMRSAGFHVDDPGMSMFVQAGGGVHRMCQPLRREAA